ncbi:hypothetical protein [Lihuaxuella thermophila]|uniref:Uncharacterized protein n=1 Tax=Lihuaxuella thermophila TaxID=1173111 RepID=A0A1H8CBF9_9BACL|nr:hypothetical protein [Lihuaxuella thermophila]SEM91754.1 hypothetical protein SAMN05444955_103159 [Lihuaxuella thermophila]
MAEEIHIAVILVSEMAMAAMEEAEKMEVETAGVEMVEVNILLSPFPSRQAWGGTPRGGRAGAGNRKDFTIARYQITSD